MLRTLTPTPIRAALGTFGVFLMLSCSVLIDTKTQQCSLDADCTNLGAAFANTTCQQNVCVAPPSTGPLGCKEAAPSSAKTVKLSFNLSFTVPADHPRPYTVQACGPLDPDCAAPVAGPIEVPFGFPAQVELDVPTGFQGSLQVTNPDGLPGQEFLGRPLEQDTKGYDLILPTDLTVQFLLAATMQDFSPEQGIFVITTRDCDRQPLVGVQVTNSAGGVPFYFQNQQPQKSLTETTAEGAAGFVNVPPGLVSIGATLNGRAMTGTSAISRGGWVTYVEIFP